MKIKIVCIIFTVSNITRAIMYITEQTGALDGYVLQVYYCMYPLWDVVPNSIIMYYHFTALVALDQYHQDQAIEESLFRASKDTQDRSTSF